jgi:hypothetical protein
MAVGEKRSTWVISQVSWTDWTAQDVYYWQEHSFQYSANINCDDELHGIKLSNKAIHTNNFSKCELVPIWDLWVAAMPLDWWDIYRIECNGSNISSQWDPIGIAYKNLKNRVYWVVFQDCIWWGWWLGNWNAMFAYRIAGSRQDANRWYAPYDHTDYTDESISDPNTVWLPMLWNITAILSYNNTRLVVAAWSDIWVYYPELDRTNEFSPIYDSTLPSTARWKTGWKKVLTYEAWVTIVALTCSFEYLKVWAVDEWWNTKIYYYQGNNNLRSTFVYNVVALEGERILHVYSLNWVDYYTTSIDWTDWYINLNKMVGNIPVKLFHQRAWLDPLDVNFKAPYFVWPTWMSADYKSGRFYIADAYGVFQFTQNQQGYDKWYMKWMLSDTGRQVYWVCENKWFLYVSDSTGCRAMRLYDTWVDGFQSEWVLISREYEGKEWGTITKMLDEIRLNYELNPLTNNKWSIDIYVSPNNLWKNTHTFTEANNWYHVMHIDNTNWATRTEKSNLFNDLWTWDNSSFKFDWQTITYAIVINQNTSTHATPIVRQIDIRYHTKDKVNNVYDIN